MKMDFYILNIIMKILSENKKKCNYKLNKYNK